MGSASAGLASTYAKMRLEESLKILAPSFNAHRARVPTHKPHANKWLTSLRAGKEAFKGIAFNGRYVDV